MSVARRKRDGRVAFAAVTAWWSRGRGAVVVVAGNTGLGRNGVTEVGCGEATVAVAARSRLGLVVDATASDLRAFNDGMFGVDDDAKVAPRLPSLPSWRLIDAGLETRGACGVTAQPKVEFEARADSFEVYGGLRLSPSNGVLSLIGEGVREMSRLRASLGELNVGRALLKLGRPSLMLREVKLEEGGSRGLCPYISRCTWIGSVRTSVCKPE